MAEIFLIDIVNFEKFIPYLNLIEAEIKEILQTRIPQESISGTANNLQAREEEKVEEPLKIQITETKENVQAIKEEVRMEKPLKIQITETKEEILPQNKPIKKLKAKKPQESKFANYIKEYLAAKDVEITETIVEKKKEYIAKIRINALFGKQEYYMIAKDKKAVTDSDLTLAHQKAQTEKMPSLLVSPGNLNKKAEEYLVQWKNLVKFEKLKL